jgi:hypothetical protein
MVERKNQLLLCWRTEIEQELLLGEAKGLLSGGTWQISSQRDVVTKSLHEVG